MEKKVTEADAFMAMLERAEKRAEEAKIKDPEKEVEKLVEKIANYNRRERYQALSGLNQV